MAQTFVKIYKRLVNGEPSSYCENVSSSEESGAHEKAIHTPLNMCVIQLPCYKTLGEYAMGEYAMGEYACILKNLYRLQFFGNTKEICQSRFYGASYVPDDYPAVFLI
jgi:hypothetical protein